MSVRKLLSPVLVAREQERAVLTHAATHPPALAIVEGESGVGKTRLIAELLRSTQLGTRRRLLGQCSLLREPLPLGPLVDALRALDDWPAPHSLSPLVGVLRYLLPEMSDRFPPLTPALSESGPERHLLFRSVAEVLAKLGPTLLVLEDLHWSDEATADFMRFLAVRLPENLSLVLTWRPEDLPSDSPLRNLTGGIPPDTAVFGVELRPLDPAQVRTLVSAILGTDVSEEFASYLHEHSSGLPLAVEELVGLIQDRRDLIRRGGRWMRRSLSNMEVPRAIRESILERVAHLSPDARRVVECAAVLGVPADEALLASVSELPAAAVSEAVSEALAAAVLFQIGEGRYGLRHALATQAVWDAIPTPRRRSLHRQAARVLEQSSTTPLGRLVHHLGHADELRKAAVVAERAAAQATALGDETQAAQLLQGALQAPGLSPADRLRLATKLGAAATRGFTHYREAVSALREVIGAAELTPDERGKARLLLSDLLHSTGEAALGHGEAALAVDELEDPRQVIAAMLQLASPCTADATLAENVEWLDRAVNIGAGLNDRDLTIDLLEAQALVLLEIGDPRAWRLVRDAIDAVRSHGGSHETGFRLAVAMQRFAGTCLAIGRHADAQTLIGGAITAGQDAMTPALAIALETTKLVACWATGAWAGLESAAQEHAELHADIPWVVAPSLLVGATLALARGEIEVALQRASTAESLAVDCGILGGVSWSSSLLGRCHLAAGDAGAAEVAVMRGLSRVAANGIWSLAGRPAPVAVEALISEGRVGEAKALTDRLADGIRDRDAPAASFALLLCNASIAEATGDLTRASEGYGHAARAAAAMPDPHAAALAKAKHGLALLARDSPDGVSVSLDALSSLGVIGATADAARLRRRLRQQGLVLPTTGRRGRKGYGDSLSPREREVAQLAAQGLTNAQIGKALFLSPATTAHHISTAMRKMSVSSRVALTRKLTQLEAETGNSEGGG